jgi:hypothetical protein
MEDQMKRDTGTQVRSESRAKRRAHVCRHVLASVKVRSSGQSVHQPSIGIRRPGLVVIGLVIGLTATTATHSSAVAGVVELPVDASYTRLLASAGTSTDDVWAVGYVDSSPSPNTTAARHWDGHVWSDATTPSPCAYAAMLTAVTAVAADDVWAVGFCKQTSQTAKPLIEHYDGTSWTRVKAPSPSNMSTLYAVSADSANDIWAVGINTHAPFGSIVEHWDGTSWSLTPAPAGWLASVKAFSPDDVWAVDIIDHQVIHWDGTSWLPIDPFSYPGGVGGDSATDVWVVGSSGHKVATSQAYRYDGSTWTPTLVAPVRGTSQGLTSVYVDSPTDVWATGATGYARSSHGYLEHWNGTSWTTVLKPLPRGLTSSVLAFGASDAWVFGQIDNTTRATNAEHWDGHNWKKYTVQ